MNLTTKSVSRLPFCLLTISLCRYWLRAKLDPEQRFWTGPLCSIVLVLQWYVFSLDDTFVRPCTSFWLLGCHLMCKYWLSWKICYRVFYFLWCLIEKTHPHLSFSLLWELRQWITFPTNKIFKVDPFFPSNLRWIVISPNFKGRVCNYSQKQMFRFYY